MRTSFSRVTYSPFFAAFVTTVITMLALALQELLGLRILPITFILGPLAAFVLGQLAGLASVGIHITMLTIYTFYPSLLPDYVPVDDRASIQVMLLAAALSLLAIVLMIGSYKRRIDALLRQVGTQAKEDPLTGVSNRRHGQELLEAELERARRAGSHLAIMLFDLDHFKRINDTYGHHAGDMALRGVTDLVRKNLRRYDTLIRWGGEEFLVILPNTDARTGLFIGERLRQLVAGASFSHGDQVTLSAGVTNARSGDTLDSLLARADALLYRTKNSGRNRVLAGLDASHSNRPAAEQLN